MRRALGYLSLLTLVFSGAVSAANAGIKKSIGNWKLECASGDCQLSTEAPSGFPVLYVDLNGDQASLASFAFFVKADIDTKHPLGFEFGNAVADKSKPGCAQATDVDKQPECFNLNAQKEDSFSGPFTLCKSGVCISKIMGDADAQKVMLPRLQRFGFVLLVFRDSTGALQSQSLDIRGFSAAYAEAAKV